MTETGESTEKTKGENQRRNHKLSPLTFIPQVTQKHSSTLGSTRNTDIHYSTFTVHTCLPCQDTRDLPRDLPRDLHTYLLQMPQQDI